MKRTLLLAATLLGAVSAQAQTRVDGAWVRSTAQQQRATGAFMTITSAAGGKLVSAQSPIAGITEVHEMSMSGDVMKMRAVPAIELPAGKAVELKPGGFHVMLMDLKQPLKAGDSVPLTLVVEGADGKRETVEVKAEVKSPQMPAQKHMHSN